MIRIVVDTRWDADIQTPIDIVTRLEWPFPHTGPLPDDALALMRDAAEEIKRLRAQWREPDGVDIDAR